MADDGTNEEVLHEQGAPQVLHELGAEDFPGIAEGRPAEGEINQAQEVVLPAAGPPMMDPSISIPPDFGRVDDGIVGRSPDPNLGFDVPGAAPEEPPPPPPPPPPPAP